MNKDLAINQNSSFNLSPRSLTEAMEYAKIIANTDLVPKDYKGKAGNVLIAVQMGAEVGLPPMAALQNIAVINGRPCLWGDALMAVCVSSPLCEYVNEEFDEETMISTCRVKRKNHKEHIQVFSLQDAEQAGLMSKPGPWRQYTKRMLQLRARTYALRNKFPDLLKGIHSAEEQQDIITYHNSEPVKPPIKVQASKIKDHHDFAELEQLIYTNKLENHLGELLNGKNYKDLPIEKFDKMKEYILKQIPLAKIQEKMQQEDIINEEETAGERRDNAGDITIQENAVS